MNKHWKTLAGGVALASIGLMASSAYAAPKFIAGVNQIFAKNLENQYRLTTNCLAGECFNHNPLYDPADWSRVIPSLVPLDGSIPDPDLPNLGPGAFRIPAEPRPGDVFAGIISIQGISDLLNVPSWAENITPGSIDQFSGYFAQEVVEVFTAPADPRDPLQTDSTHMALSNPNVDPFGILNTVAGEAMRLYVDDGAAATLYEGDNPITPGTPGSDIDAATDGVLWGSLGTGAFQSHVAATGPDLDGFMYSHIDTLGLLKNFDGEAEFAMNFIIEPYGGNFVNSQLNDPNESELGDLEVFPGVFLPATFTDVIGRTELEANLGSNLQDGNPFNQVFDYNPNGSRWLFASNDPFFIDVIPEPGTMLLLGTGLLGLAGVSRRRSRK